MVHPGKSPSSDAAADVFGESWFDALEASLSAMSWEESDSAALRLGVTILDDRSPDAGDADSAPSIRYVLTFSPDGVSLQRPGPGADAAEVDAELTQTRSTALAIIDGTTSAQMSFMSGDMRLAGDAGMLLAHRTAAVAALNAEA